MRVAAILAATGAGAMAWTAATPPPTPLEAFADSLGAFEPPAGSARRDRLRAAEVALSRAGPPREDCADTLGASRFAALHAELARARDALGDRLAALAAWRDAAACAPRDPHPRRETATLLMTLGRLDEAHAELARATTLSRRAGDGVEELRARLDYLTARWSDAARGAAAIAARLEREVAAEAARQSTDEAGTSAPAARNAAGSWRLLERLAQRRAGLPVAAPTAFDPGEDGAPWPAPLWSHLDGRLDEPALVAAIAADEAPRHRRAMTCEALYYTAQQAFAEGRVEDGRSRLARVVNLKVTYCVEHDLALAELARLRGP